MKNIFAFVLILMSAQGWAQFKPITKTTPPSIDVARLIGAEDAHNEQFANQKPSQKMQGFAHTITTGRSLQAKFSNLKVVRDSTHQQAVFIEATLKPNAKNAQARLSYQAACYEYLEGLKDILQLAKPSDELIMTNTHTDDLLHMHTKFQQTYKGLPVYGGEVLLHTNQNGETALLNGRLYPTPSIENINPRISEQQVAQLALQDVSLHAVVRMMGQLEQKLLHYDKPTTTLLIYHPNENPNAERLAWLVTIRPNFIERWQYMIDAQTGEILDKYNHTCAIDGPARANATDLNGVVRSVNTYLVGSRYYLIDATKTQMFNKTLFKVDKPVGAIWTIDASGSSVDDISVRQVSSSNNTWNNPTAVSAHYNAGVAYDYFLGTHSRNSLNGKGGTIVSVINITDENSRGFDNAFWNGEIMGYGNGRDYFKPLAGGLDVAGHEMTHGVIENSANLEYRGQSGAINESMADVFGVLIDRDDWTLGEDVVKVSAYPSGVLRSMSDPNNGGRSLNDRGYQPKNMSQYYTGSQDNYGVHINSGIPNYAFYLFANNPNVGKDRAERVYYRTLTTYLTKTSKFLDLRLAVIKASTDLYGATSAVVTAARSAFDAVGIVEPTSTPTPTPSKDIPVNTGQEAILSYDPVQKALYVSNTAPKTAADFRAVVSNVTIKQKPSITDDGKYAYFVASDNRIKRVNLQGTPTVENVSSDAVWGNVAISKDGKRLAALTKDADKSVYVFNLAVSPASSKKYTLYNPTYTTGVQTGQVQYADAIEWDHSGEFLVYDAFNKLKNAEGQTVDFWDVGFLEAWDNGKNTFGTGEIQKLFSDLEEGESIGNPSFSKNSQDILAFDYLDATDNSYYILGVNIEANKVGFVYENNTIGYPNYATKDDKLVFNVKNGSAENTNVINLNTDKVSAKGGTSLLIQDSKWAVWYSVGTRTLPQKQNQNISFQNITDKLTNAVPFDLVASATSGLPVSFVVSGPATLNGTRLTLSGAVGKVEITAFQEGNSAFYRATPVTVSFNVVPITALYPSAAQIDLFPNPTDAQVLLRLPEGSVWKSVQLFDTQGRELRRIEKQPDNNIVIDTYGLSAGVYLVGVETDTFVIWKKLLKR